LPIRVVPKVPGAPELPSSAEAPGAYRFPFSVMETWSID